MLDILKNQIDRSKSRAEQINQLRELLQIVVLKILYDAGFFKHLVFTGGTALRLVHQLNRYSEDLDFSLANKNGYTFANLAGELKQQLTKGYGLAVDFKPNTNNTVQSISLKFKNILLALGLSNHRNEKLFIKLEIDSNPPPGGKTELALVNRSYVITVTIFNLPSLYATKLHACFYRKYLKGRDFYDFIWYLSKGVEPNFTLLNNAIEQTQKKKLNITKETFKDFLLEKIKKVDLAAAKSDVSRFLIDQHELKLFDKNMLISNIKQKY